MMNTDKPKQGQIVEIPRNSHHYSFKKTNFQNKREELEYFATQPNYDLFDGILVGGHFGMEDFQLGQRKGLNLSGKAKPLYAIKKDELENRLFVGAGEGHPGLFQKAFFFPNEKIEWKIHLSLSEGEALNLEVLRNSKLRKALIYQYSDGIFIEFEGPVKITSKNEEILLLTNETIIAKIIS